MRTKQLKKCFISAPVKLDTSLLRKALERRGVSWTDAAAAEPAASILSTIWTAIQQSDFVCVVLPERSENRNVLFEMGLATGLNRPLLIFAPRTALVPLDLQGVAYARTDLTDEDAVGFHLDAFLRYAYRKSLMTSTPASKKSSRIDLSWARKALKEITAQSSQRYEVGLDRLIAKIFESSGAVVSMGEENDFGADMALWIDELQGSVGNPLIVQVKAGKITEKTAQKAEQQILALVPKVHAHAGVFIYHDPDNKRIGEAPLSWPLVMRFSAAELIDLVAAGEFATEVIRRRNDLAHGRR